MARAFAMAIRFDISYYDVGKDCRVAQERRRHAEPHQHSMGFSMVDQSITQSSQRRKGLQSGAYWFHYAESCQHIGGVCEGDYGSIGRRGVCAKVDLKDAQLIQY